MGGSTLALGGGGVDGLHNLEPTLGVLLWLETVAVPGITVGPITHQQLPRTLNCLDYPEKTILI